MPEKQWDDDFKYCLALHALGFFFFLISMIARIGGGLELDLTLIGIIIAIITFISPLFLPRPIRVRTFNTVLFLAITILLVVMTYNILPRKWADFKEARSPQRIIAEKEVNVQTMQYHLERQLINIAEVRMKYQRDIREFLREIGEEKQKYNITSITSATERVRYNVELIRERDASLTKLAEIEHITKNGYEETIYMLRQLDGAKGMAKIMANGYTLADNAEAILNKYRSYTETIAINPRELAFKSPEVIWQQYVR